MKIQSLKVNGFKNLIDCKLELENFNVLIGPNNVGKSNILEVFGFLDILLNGSDTDKMRLFDGLMGSNNIIYTFCQTEKPRMISVEVEFHNDIEENNYKFFYYIEIEVSRNVGEENEPGRITKEYFRYKNVKKTGKLITVFERTNNNVFKLPVSKLGNTEPVLSILTKIEDLKEDLEVVAQKGIDLVLTISKTPTLYNSSDAIRESLNDQSDLVIRKGRIVALPLKEQIYRILNSEKEDYFKEILNDVLGIVHIKLLDLSKDTRGPKFIFIGFEEAYRPYLLNQLSDGTLIVLTLITYLISNKYPIICIEELENSIHPKLLKKLVSLIKKSFSHVQIILTSHSPILLNMVQINEVSVMIPQPPCGTKIVRVKDKKDLIKRLSGTFSNFGDIFFEEIEE